MRLHQIAQIIDENTINVPKPAATGDSIQNIMAIVFTITAIISVLIITIAGFSYVLSGGDSNRISRAKDAIIYAIVGLVVSLLAYAIVEFVIGKAFS